MRRAARSSQSTASGRGECELCLLCVVCVCVCACAYTPVIDSINVSLRFFNCWRSIAWRGILDIKCGVSSVKVDPFWGSFSRRKDDCCERTVADSWYRFDGVEIKTRSSRCSRYWKLSNCEEGRFNRARESPRLYPHCYRILMRFPQIKRTDLLSECRATVDCWENTGLSFSNSQLGNRALINAYEHLREIPMENSYIRADAGIGKEIEKT